ncbi:uncharacterized protein RCO7_01622 [Rhynchosporium graminicola]|uniref:Ubiquitin-conjugating enzyme E2C-binding protein n=1 Tax=Rhynchosporium graminicola TaxID=2792576 RepID=A0A1E1KP79_9HELO|nr:uncharacterized protein RCO7_01622 [Rhynchosporium commune]
MLSTEPLIYAELLPNIRQLSVLVALDAPCGPGTKAELSADGQRFILQHEGDITTLNLPGQAVSNFPLQKPVLGDKELSWRIPVAGQANKDSIENAQSNEAPWSAKELSEDAEFACRDCGTIIVEKETIKEWRDLPSENWAEMMEFWHCHKPDLPPEEASGSSRRAGHVHPEEIAASKGYGATSKFTARTGIGFIDLTTFLLYSTDCANLKISETTVNHQSLASCASCHHDIGHHDHDSRGIRIYKWSLALISSQPRSIKFPSLASILSSKCLEILNANCVSRLIFEPEIFSSGQQSSASHSTSATWPCSTTSTVCSLTVSELSRQQPKMLSKMLSVESSRLLLWFLSPALIYSTSICPSTESGKFITTLPKLAMKVFWKVISADEAKTLLDGETAEGLMLPGDIVAAIGRNLAESALCLPPSARKFNKEWDVALMNRYQPSR